MLINIQIVEENKYILFYRINIDENNHLLKSQYKI